MPTPFFADLVRELAQEGGTGPLTPTGAVPGHRRFAGAVPPGGSFHYAVAGIAHPDQWEVGTGRIGGDGRLFRDAVEASSNDGAAVDFAAGLKTIALTVGAGWFAASDTQAAVLAGEMAGLGSELAGLTSALGAKQPLSTTHGSADAGEATDAVTVRRGADWVNIPLSALAFRDPGGNYSLQAPLAAASGQAVDLRRLTDGDVLDVGKDDGPRLRVFASGDTIGLFNVASAGAGRDGLRILDGGVAFDIAASEIGRFTSDGLGIGIVAPLDKLHLPYGSALRFGGDGGSAQARLRWFYDGYNSLEYDATVSGASESAHVFKTLGPGSVVHSFRIDNSGPSFLPCFRSGQDNMNWLGSAANRWAGLYAANGTINTSDAREKTWRGAATDAELRAARRIVGETGFYQWNDAIAGKGVEGARLHFGVRAQAVWAIMAAEGLIDPLTEGALPSSRYAFLCYDAWDAAGADEARPAGNRFGIRADQLALFLIAAQDARIAALEAAA